MSSAAVSLCWLFFAAASAPPAAKPAPVVAPSPPPPAAAPPADVTQQQDSAFFPDTRLGELSGALGGTVAISGGGAAFRADLRWAKVLFRSPAVTLGLTAPVGFRYLHVDYSNFGFSFSSTTRVLDFIPAARVGFLERGRIRFYASVGLGLSVAWTATPVQFQGYTVSTAVGPAFTLAAGLDVALDDRIGLFVEPVSVAGVTVPATTVSFGGFSQTAGGGFPILYQFVTGARLTL